MKIPKEQIFIIIIGLFLLSYILEAIVDPLNIKLATPYAFLSSEYFGKYPFTAATITIRAISLFLVPTFLLSFIKDAQFFKVGALLLIAGLAQLYSLQEITSGTTMVPIEWSLSLSIAGIALILPIATNLLHGTYLKAKNKLSATLDGIDTEDKQNENN